jgi:hypothetical protein
MYIGTRDVSVFSSSYYYSTARCRSSGLFFCLQLNSHFLLALGLAVLLCPACLHFRITFGSLFSSSGEEQNIFNVQCILPQVLRCSRLLDQRERSAQNCYAMYIYPCFLFLPIICWSILQSSFNGRATSFTIHNSSVPSQTNSKTKCEIILYEQ